ncbi:MAG: CotH kinase family protein [Minicystis sp.]
MGAYDPAYVHEIALTLPAADWQTLRFEGNDPWALLGAGCLDGPKDTSYSHFHAALTIDGQSFPDVDLRKKGFLGSLSISKPSLKIKLAEYQPGAKFFDVDRLTLNNAKQDASLIRTCLAFELYAKAKIPAPRCNFAHITVNGEDLGIYNNVEPIDEAMLTRTFGDPKGNLYEGQLSDFREMWRDTYAKKTNTADPDRSDLAAVSDALLADDAQVLAKLDPLLDREAFFTFWAMEALIASWDGYTNTQNNHYVYHDPKSGKLQFIPWGPDATFSTDDPLHGGDRPQSVSAWGAIPNRLYQLPEMRAHYRERALALLDSVLAEDELVAEIDRMQALLTPFADEGDGLFLSAVDEVRTFAKGRHAEISKELASGPAAWKTGLHGDPCLVELGTISGTFTTKFGTSAKGNPFTTGKGTFHLDFGGVQQDAALVGSAAGPDNLTVQIQMAANVPGAGFRVGIFFVDRSVFVPGKDMPFNWQEAFGIYGEVDPSTTKFVVGGLLKAGKLHLDQASLKEGEPVTGSFTADVIWNKP